MQDIGKDEGGRFARIADTNRDHGLFFDRLAPMAPSISFEYVAERDGAANTILLSENIQAGNWYDSEESETAFGYPAWSVLMFDPKSPPDRKSCSLPKVPGAAFAQSLHG